MYIGNQTVLYCQAREKPYHDHDLENICATAIIELAKKFGIRFDGPVSALHNRIVEILKTQKSNCTANQV